MTPPLIRLLGLTCRYRELDGLHEISQAFTAMTDIQETYSRLTRRIAELIGAEKCVISLYDPATREMIGQAPGSGVPDEIIQNFRYRVDTLRMAWNFRTQGPMVKNHPEEFHPAQREYLRPFHLFNVTVVPLVLEGRIIGMVSMGNKPGGFSQNDVRLLTVFAAQAAVAIQNARLYTRLQESAVQLEAKVRARTAELEATYRELADSHARLRDLDQLKSDFLGNVSHELRTPLAAIKGFADNLLDGVTGPLTGKQRHYLLRIHDNVDRLTRMVSDLLDLTRIEAGKIELALEALDPAETIADATESLRPLARARGIEVVLDLRGCPPIWGDPDKIHQVLTNLISNALKFTPPGGQVTVTAAPAPGGMARIAIHDTGLGIPPEERERVFDKFYQAGRVDGERPPGSGLGLTIARHLVELHRGRIWVDDGVGRGSTFVVLLPVPGGSEA
ncbi:MAG: GAF domain-containing sensor histidine kinase [Candidatus Rokubacteria bacterium]|nr:GAF domain-containing sensor histidine kinase [Candidatus Rokubacteria bacterium]